MAHNDKQRDRMRRIDEERKREGERTGSAKNQIHSHCVPALWIDKWTTTIKLNKEIRHILCEVLIHAHTQPNSRCNRWMFIVVLCCHWMLGQWIIGEVKHTLTCHAMLHAVACVPITWCTREVDFEWTKKVQQNVAFSVRDSAEKKKSCRHFSNTFSFPICYFTFVKKCRKYTETTVALLFRSYIYFIRSIFLPPPPHIRNIRTSWTRQFCWWFEKWSIFVLSVKCSYVSCLWYDRNIVCGRVYYSVAIAMINAIWRHSLKNKLQRKLLVIEFI